MNGNLSMNKDLKSENVNDSNGSGGSDNDRATDKHHHHEAVESSTVDDCGEDKNDHQQSSSPSSPSGVQRSLPPEEFRHFLKQFQVRLPSSSFIPNWVDEYSQAEEIETVTQNMTDVNASAIAAAASITTIKTSLHESQRRESACDMMKEGLLSAQKEKKSAALLEVDYDSIKNDVIIINNNLPSLPNDIIAQILSFVPKLSDILSYSQTCKHCLQNGYNNDLVWKVKFHQRWNVPIDNAMIDPIYTVFEDVIPNDDILRKNTNHADEQAEEDVIKGDLFWRRCYYNAFQNVHDLWVSHWNCVEPIDSVSAGRTVIPDVMFKKRTSSIHTAHKKHTKSNGARNIFQKRCNVDEVEQSQRETNDWNNGSNLQRRCPTCRYHPYLNKNGLAELNNAMDKELNYSRQSTTTENLEEKTVVDPVDETECTLASYSILLSGKIKGQKIEDILGVNSAMAENKRFSEETAEDQNDNNKEDYASLLRSVRNCKKNVTSAQTVYHSTQYSLAKWSRRMRAIHNFDLSKRVNDKFAALEGGNNLSDDNKHLTPLSKQGRLFALPSIEVKRSRHVSRQRKVSARAFEQSATFDRKVNVDQYRSSGLNFLTDVLFFPIEPSHKRIHQLDSIVKDEIDKNGDAKLVDWTFNMTETEHTILDIYGTKLMDTDGASAADSLSTLPQAQSMAPLTDTMRLAAHDLNTLASLGSNHETAQHSWHVVRFSNPDYIRPITFRIFSQRSDCFTSYPSEGFLLPGETCYITLCVRAMGSLLAEAYEDVNTKREEAPRFVADVFEEESVLPQSGFAIRYFYAPSIPCIPYDYLKYSDSNFSTTNNFPQTEWFPHHDIRQNDNGQVKKLWNNIQAEDEIRTIYLSVHVNGKYSFDEFQSRTMSPFEVNKRNNRDLKSENRASHYPLTFISPNLQNRDPRLFSSLHDMNLEQSSSNKALSYRTEKECICCGKDWGVRSEYLGRIFILRKAICEEFARHRSRQMCRVVDCLKFMPTLFSNVLPQDDKNVVIDIDNDLLNRIHQLLFCLHAIIISKKGDKNMLTCQRSILRSLEIYETIASAEAQRVLLNFWDELGHSQNLKKRTLFWRQGGIYNFPKITDSIEESKFQSKTLIEEIGDSSIVLKKEPASLNNVRRYCHLPGNIPVGKPVDPNHVDDGNGHFYSDVFKNDLLLGFMSAVAMVQDPRALNGQGVYHILCGSVPRCRNVELDSFIPCSQRNIKDLCLKALQYIDRQNLTQHSQIKNQIITSCNIFPVNDLDIDGFSILTNYNANHQVSSFTDFINNVPAPGIGRYNFCELESQSESNSEKVIKELVLPEIFMSQTTSAQQTTQRNHNQRRADRRPPVMLGHFGGLRLFNILWYFSGQLGLSVDDESNPGDIIVDRRILIAGEWMSNSLMFLPVFWTLLARWATLIPHIPLEYYLDGLPYELKKEMRYLTSQECGWAAIMVFLSWLGLGRYGERNINRTYERSVMDFSEIDRTESSTEQNLCNRIFVWCERVWNLTCPQFLQHRIYIPRWNKHSQKEIINYIKHTRSNDGREYRALFHASDGQRRGDRLLPVPKLPSFTTKALASCIIGILSFISVSPHYVLNFCTVFFGSVGMGISVSINFMEICRTPPTSGIFGKFDNMRLNVVVTMFFLIGQLVGSSGGLQFLAEFVVTAVGFLLGGYSTISSSGLENWFCFFCLSSIAFWGYLFARVGVSTCMRKKTTCSASSFLLFSFFLILSIWLSTAFNNDLDFPTSLMIIRFRSLVNASDSAMDALSGRHSLIMQ